MLLRGQTRLEFSGDWKRLVMYGDVGGERGMQATKQAAVYFRQQGHSGLEHTRAFTNYLFPRPPECFYVFLAQWIVAETIRNAT